MFEQIKKPILISRRIGALSVALATGYPGMLLYEHGHEYRPRTLFYIAGPCPEKLLASSGSLFPYIIDLEELRDSFVPYPYGQFTFFNACVLFYGMYNT